MNLGLIYMDLYGFRLIYLDLNLCQLNFYLFDVDFHLVYVNFDCFGTSGTPGWRAGARVGRVGRTGRSGGRTGRSGGRVDVLELFFPNWAKPQGFLLSL
jgi:hypothetical protein